MRLTVDSLLIVGIFLNLVKAGDLILRPHQVRYFQDRFEHLTLWLDFTKPLKALKTLTGEEGRLGLLVLGYVPSIIVFALLQAYQPPNELGVTLITYLNFGMLILLIKSGLATTGWLFGDGRLRSFLKRFALASVVEFAALGSLGLSVYVLSERSNGLLWLYWLLFLVVVGLVLLNLVSSTIWLACFLTILASSILLVLELILKFVRGIAWRIVEHNKGAFAAVILITTIALGFVDLYFRLNR